MPLCRSDYGISSYPSNPAVAIGSSRCNNYGYDECSGIGSFGSRGYPSNFGIGGGVRISCANKLRSTVLCIERPSFVVEGDGPILVESNEGPYIGGNTPCSRVEGNHRVGNVCEPRVRRRICSPYA